MFNYVKCEYKKQVIRVRRSSSRVQIVNLTFHFLEIQSTTYICI